MNPGFTAAADGIQSHQMPPAHSPYHISHQGVGNRGLGDKEQVLVIAAETMQQVRR
jgi:hypothetical protein